MARPDPLVFESLAATPARLGALLGEFGATALRVKPTAALAGVEVLSPIGHARHLGDIEIEGYRERIRLIRTEPAAFLPSLPGDQMAIDRAYESADLTLALDTFAKARAVTLATLGSVAPVEWARAGEFEGYGTVSLRRLIEILAEHDRLHLEALAALPR